MIGLKNELKAVDRFLGGIEGGAKVSPSGCKGQQEEDLAWEDMWILFEECRWLCSRSETWAVKFGGDIKEALPALERLSIPGELKVAAVFVSSDATPKMIAAVDWTNGFACREKVEELKPWISRVLDDDNVAGEGGLAIHLGEMLSFVAFACRVGASWSGRVVIYGGTTRWSTIGLPTARVGYEPVVF